MSAQQSFAKKGEVIATPLESLSSFTFVMSTHDHHFLADEPSDAGGLNSGPSPFEFLSASVASCTAMTLRFYAKHKNIELGHFKVTVHLEETVAENGDKIYSFKRNIFFDDPQTPELAKKMKEIADKCPVHKVITGDVRIETDVESAHAQKVG